MLDTRISWADMIWNVNEKFSSCVRSEEPKKILLSGPTDLFCGSIDNKTLRSLWDTMWVNPQHTFLVLTRHPETMNQFVHHWASSRHHGWVEAERYPIRPGDIVHIDDFWERGVCGWNVRETEINCGCACGHPGNEEHGGTEPGACDARICPIADQLDEYDEECKLDPDDPNYYGPDEGYMKIRSRPRHAFVKNIWLGVIVDSQMTVNRRIGTLLCTPAAKRFVLVEQMLGPVDLENVTLYDPGFDAYRGDKLNAFTGDPFGPPSTHYNCGGCLAAKLDWVICGDGPNVQVKQMDRIRNLRDQCVRNSTAFHFADRDGLIGGTSWKQFPEVKDEAPW